MAANERSLWNRLVDAIEGLSGAPRYGALVALVALLLLAISVAVERDGLVSPWRNWGVVETMAPPAVDAAERPMLRDILVGIAHRLRELDVKTVAPGGATLPLRASDCEGEDRRCADIQAAMLALGRMSIDIRLGCVRGETPDRSRRAAARALSASIVGDVGALPLGAPLRRMALQSLTDDQWCAVADELIARGLAARV